MALPVAEAQTWKGESVAPITTRVFLQFSVKIGTGGIVQSKAPDNAHPFARASLPPIYVIVEDSQIPLAVYGEVLSPAELVERLEPFDEDRPILAVEYTGRLLPVIGLALYAGNHLMLIPSGESIHQEVGQVKLCPRCGQSSGSAK